MLVETIGMRDWEYGVAGIWDYQRCENCLVVQINPFPTVEDLMRAYDVPYHGHADVTKRGLLSRAMLAIHDWMIDGKLAAILPAKARVLDVGCGCGDFLDRLRRFGPSRLQGIDFSDYAVSQGRIKGLDVHCGLFLDHPTDNAPYDTIFMNNYLEHTVAPSEELLHAKNLLRQGGRLVGELPNFRSVDNWIFGRFWGGNHVPRHTFQFEPQSLKMLLKGSGFRDIKVRTTVNPGHLALSMQNWLQRGREDLRANPAIRNGRSHYFGLLALLVLPPNILFSVLGISGNMRFEAIA